VGVVGVPGARMIACALWRSVQPPAGWHKQKKEESKSEQSTHIGPKLDWEKGNK
jgi:hypothetical protein